MGTGSLQRLSYKVGHSAFPQSTRPTSQKLSLKGAQKMTSDIPITVSGGPQMIHLKAIPREKPEDMDVDPKGKPLQLIVTTPEGEKKPIPLGTSWSIRIEEIR